MDRAALLHASHQDTELTNADRAYTALVRAIATCELRPGTAFNERDQAAALGMSRTPLRQALHRLAFEGLVETLPQRGVYVSLLDPKEIVDNTVVREVLEIEVLRRLIAEDRPVDFAKLDALLVRMKQTIVEKDAEAFLEADEDFHLTLAKAAGNRPALEAIRRSWIHVNRVRYLQHQDMKGLGAALSEHRAMVEGLRRGDPERTQAAVASHMQRSRARLEELTRILPDAFTTDREDTFVPVVPATRRSRGRAS